MAICGYCNHPATTPSSSRRSRTFAAVPVTARAAGRSWTGGQNGAGS